jgi:prepilin-type N-terminal cleavage/methylation domain-containing protein
MPGESLMMQNRGFTLIEVMVTLFLIVVMIISIFSIFPQTRKGLAHAEARVNAAILGRSILDNQRSLGYDFLTSLTGTTTYNGLNNGAPFTQIYNYQVDIQNVDTDKKQVWVTISWKDQSGSSQLTLETLVVKL